MIVYKLDKPTQMKADAQIRDMGSVLSEIAPTLRILRDLVNEHQTSLYEKNINEYREELQLMITESIRLTHLIAINSQRLCSVSDIAAKQLAALDDQVSAALKGRSIDTVTPQSQSDTTTSTHDITAAPRASQRPMSFAKTLSRV